MTITGFMLAHAITEQLLERDLHDGIKAAVRLYYDDYTDATELEIGFVRALDTLSTYLSFNLDEDQIRDLVREAEAELRSEGRKVRTFEDPKEDDD